MPFNTAITGRSTQEIHHKAGASHSAARSGALNERFLGTISPMTM